MAKDTQDKLSNCLRVSTMYYFIFCAFVMLEGENDADNDNSD